MLCAKQIVTHLLITGQRFAMMEMKTIIATLVHNFYLQPIHNLKDIPFLADFILRLKHPLHVKVVPV